MQKKIRASAIVLFNNELILIKREKGYGGNKNIYFTIPGGTVENDETIKSAAIREVYEETGVKIRLRNTVYHLCNNEKDEYFFLADYESGDIGSGEGIEFINSDYDKYGSYEIFMAKKQDIIRLNLVPPEIKEYILQNIDEIFNKK